MTTDTNCPAVVLSSGHSLRLRSVMLFNQQAVAEIAELRAKAAKGLASSGIGVGVLGSPSLTLALEAGAMLAVSGLLANAAQKTALDYLSQADDKYSALLRNGAYFNTDSLQNLHIPRPDTWWVRHGTRQETVDLADKSRSEIESFLAANNRSRSDVIGWKVKIDAPGRYVHNGDEFLNVATDVGRMCIRWSEVVTYYPPQPTEETKASERLR